jgi:hypothetical protein
MKKIELRSLLDIGSESLNSLLIYKKGVVDLIRQESGMTNLSDLVLYMYMVYHPNWRPTKKRGAKIKWSEFLNCAIAAEVNGLKNRNRTRNSVIHEMSGDSRWSKLIKKDSKDPIGNISAAEKDGKKLALYPIMVKARKFAIDNDDLNRYYSHIDLAIKKAIKKN